MARTARTAATSRSEPGEALKTYELFLGFACDEKCLFCSQESAWRTLAPRSFEEIARRIYLAHGEGCRGLALNGGEPTLRKDFLKIVALARRTGFTDIHMQTNGLRLASEEFSAGLARAGLTSARLSLHGHTGALHDGLVLVPGALKKALQGLDNLRRAGVEVGVNTVLVSRNAPALPDFYRFFLDRGVTDFGLIYPLFEGDMAANLKAMRISLTEAAPFVRAAFDVFRERRAEPPILLNFPPCTLQGFESRILRWSSDGAGYYDGAKSRLIDPEQYTLAQPDGKDKGLDEAAREGKTKPSACRSCVYDARCLGVERRYVAEFGDAEFKALSAVPDAFDAAWTSDKAAWRRLLTPAEHAALRAARRDA